MQKIRIFLEMIKFPHTVFALPFALSSAFIAAGGLPSFYQFFWIIAAMVGARTGAMAFNRLADAYIDAKNPRTMERALPKGILSKTQVGFYVALSFGLLVFSAYRLNKLCFYLSFFAVFFLMFYSYTKRFTSFAHLVLGICLGAAPVGAWIAVRGTVELLPVILGGAVVFWVAGFDVLYALQDLDFDKRENLYSIPVRFGVRKSIALARSFHFFMIIFLVVPVLLHPFGKLYLTGLLMIAALLIYEHSLVSEKDLSKLNLAFFNMNGYISVVFLLFVTGDIYWRRFYE